MKRKVDDENDNNDEDDDGDRSTLVILVVINTDLTMKRMRVIKAFISNRKLL